MCGVKVNPIVSQKGRGGVVGDSKVASFSMISGVSRSLYSLRQLKYLLNMYTINKKEYEQNILIVSKHVASE